MNLKIGSVNDNNNLIQEATDDMKINQNNEIISSIKQMNTQKTNTQQPNQQNSTNTQSSIQPQQPNQQNRFNKITFNKIIVKILLWLYLLVP